jgi:hypothetical protein
MPSRGVVEPSLSKPALAWRRSGARMRCRGQDGIREFNFGQRKYSIRMPRGADSKDARVSRPAIHSDRLRAVSFFVNEAPHQDLDAPEGQKPSSGGKTRRPKRNII